MNNCIDKRANGTEKEATILRLLGELLEALREDLEQTDLVEEAEDYFRKFSRVLLLSQIETQMLISSRKMECKQQNML